MEIAIELLFHEYIIVDEDDFIRNGEDKTVEILSHFLNSFNYGEVNVKEIDIINDFTELDIFIPFRQNKMKDKKCISVILNEPIPVEIIIHQIDYEIYKFIGINTYKQYVTSKYAIMMTTTTE